MCVKSELTISNSRFVLASSTSHWLWKELAGMEGHYELSWASIGYLFSMQIKGGNLTGLLQIFTAHALHLEAKKKKRVS